MTSWGGRGKARGRRLGVVPAVLTLALLATACTSAPGPSAAPDQSADPALAAAVADAVRKGMETWHLRSVIVKVTRGEEVVTRQAFGTSMDGVPTTNDMRFRNGAVAFAYIGTLLMQFVDEHKVTLEDPIDRWMPTLPEAGKVTLKMLANQTSGYPDFETDKAWLAAFNADPFHLWTFEERLRYAFARPMQFAPGTNWSYAHTNFMVLGEILSKIGGKPLATLLREKVLDPMKLTSTVETQTSEIPSPVLHAYSSERRVAVGIPPTGAFYEESTFWNTQWGTPIGANQTTTIDDMATTAVAVGSGSLLSRASYEAMTAPNLLGFGCKEGVCEPSCFTQIPVYNFGLGVIRSGSWLMQNPELSGYSATEAYLPSEKIAIAVVVTYLPGAFDNQGNYPNYSDTMFRAIGAVVAPKDPPPPLPS
jgi:CubicO group peptidase (beta-lactamase class C family)